MNWLQGTRFMPASHKDIPLRRGGASGLGKKKMSQGWLEAAEPGENGGMSLHRLVERGPWRGQEVPFDLRVGDTH